MFTTARSSVLGGSDDYEVMYLPVSEQISLVTDGILQDLYEIPHLQLQETWWDQQVNATNTLNGKLYANLMRSGSDSGKPVYFEIYRYDGDKFVRHSKLPSSLNFTGGNTYGYFHQSVEFDGYQYLATGKLYRTSNMITAKTFDLGDAEVNDLRVIGDKLYALCSEETADAKGNVAFENSLRVTTDGKTFTEVFRFTYPVRALSFTYGNGTVFLGMGFGTKARKDSSLHDENGMILAVNRVL